MTYEINKTYTMKVAGLRKNSIGRDYLAIYDDDGTKEYRVNNVLKFQLENVPNEVNVIVSDIDATGKILFKQDEASLYKDFYKKGKLYGFSIVDVKEDYNTNASYYIIEDDYAQHRFYFSGEQEKEIGDTCILEVDNFTEKGFVRFKEVEHVVDDNVETEIISKTDDPVTEDQLMKAWDSLPVLQVGDESETIEYKSTIVFPPDGKGLADIDKQLYNIIKEICAFSNTKGGTLYIGIHDSTKKIIGIEGDYNHLNEGDDEYNGSYKPNNDGYELKIRNTIDRMCPSVVNSNISFKFEEVDNNIYCKVDVVPAHRPVFLNGTQLFVRQGNRVKRLKGDEITFFIYERMTVSIKAIVDTDDFVTSQPIDVEAMRSIARQLINERGPIIPLPLPPSLDEIDYWVIWYNDRTWVRKREKSLDSNVFVQVPVMKRMSDPTVVFCYETGNVNTVKLSKMRSGVSLNKKQKNGWCDKANSPMSIFIVDPSDLLVGYSVDHTGTEYVKIHALQDFNPTDAAKNQGGLFAPKGMKMESFIPIGAEHKKKVERLIVTKQKKSTEKGTPLNSPIILEELNYLESLTKAE